MKQWSGWLVLALVACEDTTSQEPPYRGESSASAAAALSVPIGGERAFVRLDKPAVVGASDLWDLSFEGYNVYTNSGPSGSGQGSAFGPFTLEEFDEAVQVPLTFEDRSGGAFLDWYLYEGAPAHVLWSRFHVYAVRDGERLWKVQILGYYGQIDGAPVTAVYRLRYAEFTGAGSGPVQELAALDASAGGASAPSSAPSSCLDLGSGAILSMTPDEALARSDWHLCFRRQNIAVNGGQSGPRGVEAADLQASETEGEALAQVKSRSGSSEEARFLGISREDSLRASFVLDGVQSVFGASWVDRAASPPAPEPSSWVVVGADGKQRFRVRFDRFEGASDLGPGTLFLSVRPD